MPAPWRPSGETAKPRPFRTPVNPHPISADTNRRPVVPPAGVLARRPIPGGGPMTRISRQLFTPRCGAATIEYAIVVGLIAVPPIGVIWQFGPKLVTRWSTVNSKLDDANSIVIIDSPPPKPQKP